MLYLRSKTNQQSCGDIFLKGITMSADTFMLIIGLLGFSYLMFTLNKSAQDRLLKMMTYWYLVLAVISTFVLLVGTFVETIIDIVK